MAEKSKFGGIPITEEEQPQSSGSQFGGTPVEETAPVTNTQQPISPVSGTPVEETAPVTNTQQPISPVSGAIFGALPGAALEAKHFAPKVLRSGVDIVRQAVGINPNAPQPGAFTPPQQGPVTGVGQTVASEYGFHPGATTNAEFNVQQRQANQLMQEPPPAGFEVEGNRRILTPINPAEKAAREKEQAAAFEEMRIKQEAEQRAKEYIAQKEAERAAAESKSKPITEHAEKIARNPITRGALIGANAAEAYNRANEPGWRNKVAAGLNAIAAASAAAPSAVKKIPYVGKVGPLVSPALTGLAHFVAEEPEQKAGGGSIVKKLAGPLTLGALSIPQIAEAREQLQKGHVGEAAGTAADIGSMFLPNPLMALYMGLSPSELGDSSLRHYNTEMYNEGDTGLLKGSSLPRYAPGGGVIKKFAEAFEPIVKSGAQLKREAEYAHDIIPTHTFSDPNKLSIQDLQGGVLIGVPGDRTLAGHSLMSVNGVPLSAPVELHGGPRYGQRKADLGEDAFWASQYGAASTLQNKAARAAEAAKGNPVFGMYAAMAPDASNYALHHTEALLNQLDALSPNKAKLRAFDSIIRDKYPEFLGMTHPEVMDQFAGNSELRKHVAERLNKSTIANEYGLPSGEATIHAITEPALRNVKTGTTGYSVGELNPFAELKPELEHPTYDTQIPGSFKGQMIAQLPWEYYFPDVAKKIASNPTQAPHAWGTFKMGDFNQPVTQELVDKIAPIEEMVESATKDFGKADGGKIIKAASDFIVPAVNRLNMNFKDVTKRIPELTKGAQELQAGNLTREQYEQLVNTHKPVTPYSFVPKPATAEEAINALTEDKKAKYGLPSQILEAGYPVGLRLDIPSYTNHGVWVPTVHEQASGFGAGKSIGHESVASVLNPQFGMSEKAAQSIAAGKPKGTIATIKGEWNPVDQNTAVAQAQDYLNHPDWRQVGMDPERHGYFYDRHTMEPITHAEEALQIGPLVLAKKPTYGSKEDFLYAGGGLVALADGGLVHAFDPEGEDYDYSTALAHGMGPDGTGENAGHWGSVAPAPEHARQQYNLPEDSYVVLKGKSHPTFYKAEAAENERGSEIVKLGDRYYSIPKK